MALSIAETFLERKDSSLSDLEKLSKAFAEKLEFKLKSWAKKAETVEVIAQHLGLEEARVNPGSNSVGLARIQLQKKQLDLEKEKELKQLGERNGNDKA
ncbi:hypothetical protein scyTo_0017603 [Scyliorhinus torazame]|uniref:Uncharacterized protein n=1 Tax=Scyliorhinus torazame TaxID=75743 RepID=A0A401PWG0_SCYTO|nr:hypothetical protein [Scyliorhinus torazame]